MITVRVHTSGDQELVERFTTRRDAAAALRLVEPQNPRLRFEVENAKHNVIWSSYYGRGPAGEGAWKWSPEL